MYEFSQQRRNENGDFMESQWEKGRKKAIGNSFKGCNCARYMEMQLNARKRMRSSDASGRPAVGDQNF